MLLLEVVQCGHLEAHVMMNSSLLESKVPTCSESYYVLLVRRAAVSESETVHTSSSTRSFLCQCIILQTWNILARIYCYCMTSRIRFTSNAHMPHRTYNVCPRFVHSLNVRTIKSVFMRTIVVSVPSSWDIHSGVRFILVMAPRIWILETSTVSSSSPE